MCGNTIRYHFLKVIVVVTFGRFSIACFKLEEYSLQYAFQFNEAAGGRGRRSSGQAGVSPGCSSRAFVSD